MGYEYDHPFPHKHNNTFLPMFCRLSIKDVQLNSHCKNPTSTRAGEPSSPKVTCIGQVKRNNRVTGFPTVISTVTTAGAHHHKHVNPRKLFPSKNLLSITAAGADHQKHINSKKPFPGDTLLQNTIGSGAAVYGGCERSGMNTRCRTSKQIVLNNSRNLRIKSDQDCSPTVDIGEMDPPLPVVKKVTPPGDEVNIWKRRFNGVGLENLQIKQINLPNRKFEACTEKNRVIDKCLTINQ